MLNARFWKLCSASENVRKIRVSCQCCLTPSWSANAGEHLPANTFWLIWLSRMRLPFSSKEEGLKWNLLESNCRRYDWNTVRHGAPSGAYLSLTGKIRLKHSSLVFSLKLRFGFPAEDSGLRLPNLVLCTDGTATEKYGGRRRGSLRVNIFLSRNCLLCRKKKTHKNS